MYFNIFINIAYQKIQNLYMIYQDAYFTKFIRSVSYE